LRLDLPGLIVFLHLKNDPIAAIIGNIYKEQDVSGGVRLSKVEFSQSSFSFHQLRELDIPERMSVFV